MQVRGCRTFHLIWLLHCWMGVLFCCRLCREVTSDTSLMCCHCIANVCVAAGLMCYCYRWVWLLQMNVMQALVSNWFKVLCCYGFIGTTFHALSFSSLWESMRCKDNLAHQRSWKHAWTWFLYANCVCMDVLPWLFLQVCDELRHAWINACNDTTSRYGKRLWWQNKAWHKNGFLVHEECLVMERWEGHGIQVENGLGHEKRFVDQKVNEWPKSQQLTKK